jgi:flagellar motor protein MotB
MARIKAGLALFFLLLWPTLGQAATQRFAAFALWPHSSETDYFFTSSSQGLSRSRYNFGVSNHFDYRPLRQRFLPDGEIRSVIAYDLGHFISADVGLTDSWQIGFVLPIFSRARFQAPSSVSPGPGFQNISRLGDLRLITKIRLKEVSKNFPGIAFEPFLTVPLGSDDVYLGESSVTGGFKAIGDYHLTSRLRLALNLGLEFRERVRINNVDFQHLFLSGLGLSADLPRGLTASAEVQSITPLTHFFSEREATPVEFIGGVRWNIGQTGFSLSGGGGTCAICGVRGAAARAFLNVSYRNAFKKEASPILQSILFDTGRTTPTSQSMPVLKQAAETIRRFSKRKILIEGHTDSVGPEKYNQRLSAARAKSVYQFLVDHGAVAKFLTYTGYGEKFPIAENRTRKGRRQNRRVELRMK